MMFTSWVATADATDPSESTFAASARLIGAATLALIRDIAARSGSGSPAIFSSSSLVRTLYWPSSFFLEPMLASWSGGLRDVRRLGGLGGRGGVVGQDVERGCQVDGDRDVRVHQRHRCALGKLLSREPVELLPGEGLVSVSHPVLLLSVGLGATPRSRAAGARRATG